MSIATGVINEKILFYIDKFLSEIELCFDYVNVDILRKEIEREDFIIDFSTNLVQVVKPFQDNIESTKSLKTKDLLFMEKITLFNGLLPLDVFKAENKNTKKSLLNYVRILYNLCKIDENMSIEEVDKVLTSLVPVPAPAPVPVPPPLPPMPDLAGLSGLFQNKNIMDIAAQVSQQMQRENINPMQILSAMMTGNTSQFSGFMSSVQQTLDTAVQEKRIDKEELEQEGQKFIELIDSVKSEKVTEEDPKDPVV